MKMVRFDRAAPGEGMVIYSRVENGKAYLKFQFFLKTSEMQVAEYHADIRVFDMSGKLMLEITYPLEEEEPAKGMLLHPHLWKGFSDPYLYFVKVHLQGKEKPDSPLDVLERQLPLRTLKENPPRGWLLNEEMFMIRPVVYSLPAQIAGSMSRLERMQTDLQLLKEMGANTVCLERAEIDDDFIRLCDEMGMLVWYLLNPMSIPVVNDLLSAEGGSPTDSYYYYKACWSDEPFVYLVSKSLKRQENGNYSLMAYSNRNKVALYVEGILFEFLKGEQVFLFEEIPIRKYPLQLTAEAGECRVSLTVY